MEAVHADYDRLSVTHTRYTTEGELDTKETIRLYRGPEVGVESPSVAGRLGGVEPMTKPHFTECGLLLTKGVMAFGNRESGSTIVSRA